LDSLHTRLKRDTAAAHAQLETFIAAANFFSTRHGYVAYLSASRAFQAEAEQALSDSAAHEVIPDWPLRQRAQLARQDLELLGSPVGPDPTRPGRLAPVASPEWVLGTAYVIEGATLGGGVLLKSVTRLSLGPGRGVAFLTSYGRHRSAMWQTFLTTLSRWEQRGIDQAAVVHAAAMTFEAARWHFEQVIGSVPGPLRLSV
jgi:heme oxygenase